MYHASRRGIQTAHLKCVRPQLIGAVDVARHISHHERHRDEIHPPNLRLRAERVRPMIRVVVHAVERAVAVRIVHGGAIDVIVVVLRRAPALVSLQFGARCVIIVIRLGSIA